MAEFTNLDLDCSQSYSEDIEQAFENNQSWPNETTVDQACLPQQSPTTRRCGKAMQANNSLHQPMNTNYELYSADGNCVFGSATAQTYGGRYSNISLSQQRETLNEQVITVKRDSQLLQHFCTDIETQPVHSAGVINGDTTQAYVERNSTADQSLHEREALNELGNILERNGFLREQVSNDPESFSVSSTSVSISSGTTQRFVDQNTNISQSLQERKASDKLGIILERNRPLQNPINSDHESISADITDAITNSTTHTTAEQNSNISLSLQEREAVGELRGIPPRNGLLQKQSNDAEAFSASCHSVTCSSSESQTYVEENTNVAQSLGERNALDQLDIILERNRFLQNPMEPHHEAISADNADAITNGTTQVSMGQNSNITQSLQEREALDELGEILERNGLFQKPMDPNLGELSADNTIALTNDTKVQVITDQHSNITHNLQGRETLDEPNVILEEGRLLQKRLGTNREEISADNPSAITIGTIGILHDHNLKITESLQKREALDQLGVILQRNGLLNLPPSTNSEPGLWVHSSEHGQLNGVETIHHDAPYCYQPQHAIGLRSNPNMDYRDSCLTYDDQHKQNISLDTSMTDPSMHGTRNKADRLDANQDKITELFPYDMFQHGVDRAQSMNNGKRQKLSSECRYAERQGSQCRIHEFSTHVVHQPSQLRCNAQTQPSNEQFEIPERHHAQLNYRVKPDGFIEICRSHTGRREEYTCGNGWTHSGVLRKGVMDNVAMNNVVTDNVGRDNVAMNNVAMKFCKPSDPTVDSFHEATDVNKDLEYQPTATMTTMPIQKSQQQPQQQPWQQSPYNQPWKQPLCNQPWQQPKHNQPQISNMLDGHPKHNHTDIGNKQQLVYYDCDYRMLHGQKVSYHKHNYCKQHAKQVLKPLSCGTSSSCKRDTMLVGVPMVTPPPEMLDPSSFTLFNAPRQSQCFTLEQHDFLEESFMRDPFINKEKREQMANMLGVSSEKIVNWFCYRRAKYKRTHPDEPLGGIDLQHVMKKKQNALMNVSIQSHLTEGQKQMLEEYYMRHQFIRGPAKKELADRVGVSEMRLRSWFIVRRRKTKNKDGSTTVTSTKIPCTTVSSTTVPSTTVSSTAVPRSTVPSTTVPSTTVPSTTVPSTTVTSTAVPSTTVPSTTVPSTTVPSTTVPSTKVPSTTVPSTTVTSTAVPSTTVPSTTGPSTTVPSTTVPSTTVCGTTVPSTTVPSTTVPSTAASGTTVRSTTVPSTTSPDCTVPRTRFPSTAVPNSTAPSTAISSTTVSSST